MDRLRSSRAGTHSDRELIRLARSGNPMSPLSQSWTASPCSELAHVDARVSSQTPVIKVLGETSRKAKRSPSAALRRTTASASTRQMRSAPGWADASRAPSTISVRPVSWSRSPDSKSMKRRPARGFDTRLPSVLKCRLPAKSGIAEAIAFDADKAGSPAAVRDVDRAACRIAIDVGEARDEERIGAGDRIAGCRVEAREAFEVGRGRVAERTQVGRARARAAGCTVDSCRRPARRQPRSRRRALAAPVRSCGCGGEWRARCRAGRRRSPGPPPRWRDRRPRGVGPLRAIARRASG